MGRFRREKNVGKRRTVLQLDDGNAYQKEAAFGELTKRAEASSRQGGGNPLRGLVGHYGDSDEERSEEEIENGHSEADTAGDAGTGSAAPMKKRDTLDSEVANFLAEIDAISTPGADGEESEDMPEKNEAEEEDARPDEDTACSVDGEPMSTLPQNSTQNAEDTEQDMSMPEAPTTEWQHLLDETTQAYYFWNTTTNEVTWEIPPSYSQYLLRYKEYEEAMIKYESYMAEKKASEEQNSDRNNVVDSTERFEPLVQYSLHEEMDDDTGSETEEPYHAPTQQPDTVYGPELPSNSNYDSSAGGQIGPQMPDSNEVDSGLDGERFYPDDQDDDEDEEFIGPCLPSGGETQNYEESQNEEREIDSSAMIGPDSDSQEGLIGPILPAKEAVIGPSLPTEEAVIGPSLSSSEVEPKAGNQSKGSKDSSAVRGGSEDSDDLEAYALRELEEPVFSHYEFYNKKYEAENSEDAKEAVVTSNSNPPENSSLPQNKEASEDDLDDFDDIDRQLDMALEKKQGDSNQGAKVEHSPHQKRKLGVTDTVSQSEKRFKGDEKSLEDSIKQKRREDFKIKAEIADLSSLISSKLDFLEVSRKGLSKLHILLVQMETRLQDWKDGALDLKHLLSKLQEADSQLRQYESSAAPPGWSCHWDRMYSRYFYTNAATGDSQWDYPSAEEQNPAAEQDDEDEDSDDSDESQSQPAKVVTNGNQSMVSSTTDLDLETEDVYARPAFVTSTTAESDQNALQAGQDYASNPDSYSHLPAAHVQDASSTAYQRKNVHDPVELYNMFKAGEPLPPGTEPLINPVPPPPPPEPSSVSSLGIDLNLPAPPPPPDSPPRQQPVVAPASPELVDMEIEEEQESGPEQHSDDQMESQYDVPSEDYIASLQTSQPFESAVIARPPQPPSSFSSSTQLPQPLSSTLTAPPLIMYPQTSSGTSTPNQSPPHPSASAGHHQMAASASSYDGASLSAYAANAPPQPPTTVPPVREKKKKKEKGKVPSGSLALKKKNLPSLVHRWQQVQQEVVRQTREEEEAEPAFMHFEKWKKDMIDSGEAADNPNFQAIPDDWRERLKQRKKKEPY